MFFLIYINVIGNEQRINGKKISVNLINFNINYFNSKSISIEIINGDIQLQIPYEKIIERDMVYLHHSKQILKKVQFYDS